MKRHVGGYVMGIERSGEAGERLCTGDREKWRGWWEAMYWETNKPMHQKVLTLNPFIISPCPSDSEPEFISPAGPVYKQSQGFSVLPPLFITARYCCLVEVVGKKKLHSEAE